ncbi:hypothetical protein IW262DRAFT_1510271 [Armillaria fumosa]|nr:hypothetical protein IW262DRAFT_1510271 [Armillaria fumosa]
MLLLLSDQVLDNISVLCSSCQQLSQRCAPTPLPWSRLHIDRGLTSFLGGEITELLITGSGYKTRPCLISTSEAVDRTSKAKSEVHLSPRSIMSSALSNLPTAEVSLSQSNVEDGATNLRTSSSTKPAPCPSGSLTELQDILRTCNAVGKIRNPEGFQRLNSDPQKISYHAFVQGLCDTAYSVGVHDGHLMSQSVLPMLPYETRGCLDTKAPHIICPPLEIPERWNII